MAVKAKPSGRAALAASTPMRCSPGLDCHAAQPVAHFALDSGEHLCYYEGPRPVAGRVCAPPARVSVGLGKKLAQRCAGFFFCPASFFGLLS